MPVQRKPKSVEEFFKTTKPIDIHLAFEEHVKSVLSCARLAKRYYYQRVADELAAKETLIDVKKKLRYDLLFDEEARHAKAPHGMWVYVASKLEMPEEESKDA